MKEGINFAQTHPKGSAPLDKLKSLRLESRPLTPLAVGLAALVISLFTLNLLATTAQKKYLSQKSDLEKTLNNLKQKEKVLLSVVQKQKDLEFVRNQKSEPSPKINLVKESLPEDTILTFLSVAEPKIVISAQTPTGLSFSQFLANLLETRLCVQLSLTQSLYVQRQNSFSFSLECLLKV